MSDETICRVSNCNNQVMAWRLKPERLHPDLEPYLSHGRFGLYLDHPLLQELSIDPQFAALANYTYKYKRAELAKACKQRDWETYVFLHMRSHRFDALMGIVDCISNQRDYWELLSSVWIDSENLVRDDEEWFSLWNARRRWKRFAMTAEERKAFRLLPDELTIYRGIRENGNKYGLSWTLDRDKAIWFARRDGSDARPVLLTARAKISDVHALLLGRKESEVVIDKLKMFSTESISS